MARRARGRAVREWRRAACRRVRTGKRQVLLVMLVVAWVSGVATGGIALYRYASVAGASGAPPSQWPQSSRLPHATDCPTLVLLAHPRCSCTRASLEALARLLSQRSQRVAAHVLLVRPSGAPAGWEHGPIERAARAMLGVTVHVDVHGDEAARFAVATSGHVLIYDPQGRLMFSGGLTPARGHGGACAGTDAAAAALDAAPNPSEDIPVFGCSLTGASPSTMEVLP